MSSRAALLRASLLAVAAPLVACGGDTTDGTTGAAGQAGAAQGGGGGSPQAGSGGAPMAGSGGAAAKTKFPCTSPVAILVDGKDTGYDTCAAGEVRRREVKDCPSLVPRATTCSTGSMLDACKLDSDCKDKPNGYCANTSSFGGPGCACAYGCTTDAECGAGSMCLCGDPIGRCVPSSCKDASSCPAGDCTSYDASPGCSFTSFACQSAGDTCGGDKDCAGTSAPLCAYPSGAAGGPSVKACQPTGCAIGRPMFVDAGLRFASLAQRRDWT